jgi:hypothetical protein
MIRAAQRPRGQALFLAGALAAGAVQLFSQEFYAGLELLRPLILWLALRGESLDRKQRLRRVLLAWLPFLLLFAGYFAWRTALMPTPGTDRNAPEILYGLFTAPAATLVRLGEMVLQDLVQILLGVWYAAVRPDLFTLYPPAGLAAWAVTALVSAVTFLVFRWAWRDGPRAPGAADEDWYRTAAPFGFAAVLAGFLPGWMIGRHIYDLTGIYNDRFGLAAMFGAAVLSVALVEMLLRTQAYRLALACLLVGLGAGQNFRFETTYRWAWEKQARMYWQLKWRAPELKKPTNVYGEGSIASFVGGQFTSSVFNLMYGPVRDPRYMDFRYFDVTKVDVDAMLEVKEPLVYSLGYLEYVADPGSNLVFSYAPEKQQCLWLLSEKDAANPYVPEALAEALPLANLDQVLPTTERGLRRDIFGAEPAHDWCYYYQKGELAGQFADWERVVALWAEAEQQGRRPRNGVEYGVFIEGFANTGDWDAAFELTRKASFPKYEMRAYLCSAWARITTSTPASPEKDRVIPEVIDVFECQDEFRVIGSFE